MIDLEKLGISNDRKALKTALLLLISFRIAVLTVCAFLPLSLPEIWRQTDTLGVTLRYWLRWTIENGARMPLLPAVLNSGNTSGIMPMEFPILNMVFAPLFVFGPYWGRVLCMLGILILVHGLLFLNFKAWKKQRQSIGVDLFGFFLIAVATFSSGWTGKFIPDLTSVLLVLLGVGISWSVTRPLQSGLLCATGILMKPTSVVVLVLYLAHPRAWRRIKSNFIWGASAVITGIAYYVLGVRWIRHYQDGPDRFAIAYRPFFSSLIAFFSEVNRWTNMWMYRPFFSLGLIIVLPLSLIAVGLKKPGYKRFLALWLVLLIQYVLIAGLDGTHAYGHDYYFLGLAPTCALILWWLLSQHWPRWIPLLIFVGITIPTIELSLTDLKPLYRPALRNELLLPVTCQAIKAHHPEIPWSTGMVFRSPDEEYPSLGLCFGERQGSQTAKYGFFWKWDPIPSGCKPLESRGQIVLATCSRNQ